jgi:DME family drug/metabolite transporter
MSPKGRASLAVLGAAVLFGTSGTSKALLIPDAAPISVAALRLVVGAAGLVIFVRWIGRTDQFQALLRRPIIWAMGAAVAGYQGMFFIALGRTGIAVGTLVCLGSAPLMAGLLGWLVREGAPGWLWAGVTAIAVTGLAMLTLGSEIAPDPVGILAALGAAACYAGYTVFGARLARDGFDSSAVMAAPFAIAAVLLLPFLLIGGTWWVSGDGLVIALWLGLAATTGAYILFGKGLTLLQPGHIATLTLAEPVVATMLGVFVLAEAVSVQGWIGCVLVILALALLGVMENRRIDAKVSA